MDSQQKQHLEHLKQDKQRRLRVLERQNAQMGLQTPPHIITEIEDIKVGISKIDKELNDVKINGLLPDQITNDIDVQQEQNPGSSDPETRKMQTLIRHQELFDDTLRKSIPGAQKYHHSSERNIINRTMTNLSSISKDCDLWWFKGGSQYFAYPIRRDGEIWIIQDMECAISEIIIFRSQRYERQYILLHLSPQKPFGVNDINIEDSQGDVAGYYQGKYIPRYQLEDGYTIIDEQIVRLDGVEYRTRNLKDDFLFLSPKFCVINHKPNDKLVERVYDVLTSVKKIDISLLKQLETLEVPMWMTTWD